MIDTNDTNAFMWTMVKVSRQFFYRIRLIYISNYIFYGGITHVQKCFTYDSALSL